MSVQLQLEQMSGYLAARFIGVGVPDDVSRQFELIAERCKSTNNDKLLIDTTGAEAKNISITDRFFFAERLAIFARCLAKVAHLGKPEHIDPGGFGKLVAQNRGINAEGFTDFQAAEEWLLR
jgi:hypothetical protein